LIGVGMPAMLPCPKRVNLPRRRIFCPLVYSSATPRAIVCMASVAMKGGTLKLAIIPAFIMLHKTPIAIPTAMASTSDSVALKAATDKTPDNAMTEPADRSIIPQIISMVSPKATIVVTDNCRAILDRLVNERKFGLSSEQITNKIANTRKIPCFCIILPILCFISV